MEAKMIPISKIRPAPFQPREIFDKDKISELARSIKENDLIEPIVVRQQGETYQIIAGERRWRAWHEIGRKDIPAIIRNVDDKAAMELSLIENWHREDLSSTERENMVYRIWKTGKYKSHDELAIKLGAARTYIGELIRAKEMRDKEGYKDTISTRVITRSAALDVDDRKKLIERIDREEIPSTSAKFDEYVKVVKEAPESVKEAILKPKSVVTPDIARSVMRVEDKGDQELVLSKIQKERIEDRDEVDKLVQVVKSAPESLKEAVFKPKSSITPDIALKVASIPSIEKQKEVVRNVEQFRMNEEEAEKFVEVAKVQVEKSIEDDSKWKKVGEEYQSWIAEMTKKAASPEEMAKAKLWDNSIAHMKFVNAMESACCPICGAGADKLVWSCHKLSLKDASVLADKKLQEYIDTSIRKKKKSDRN